MSVVHLHISANLVVIIILPFPMSFLLQAFIDVEILRSGCGKKQYDSNSFTANIANLRQPYNVIFSGMTKKFAKNVKILYEHYRSRNTKLLKIGSVRMVRVLLAMMCYTK